MDTGLRISSPQIEGILQVSKWLKAPMLLADNEMRQLWQEMGGVHIMQTSCPVPCGSEEISVEMFCDSYERYLQALLKGESVECFKPLFSCAISTERDDFYLMPLPKEGMGLVKPIRPVIQMQAHYFFYSTVDRQFHSMVQGKESVAWGIQFSYPQLFQDPQSKRIVKVTDQELFQNTALFATLMRWMRSHTLPTPFVIDGVKTNATIRLGKQAALWVNTHPQLLCKGIKVQEV